MQHTRTPRSRTGAAGALLLVILIGVGIMLFLMFGPMGKNGNSYTETVLDSKRSMENTIADTIQVHEIVQHATMFTLGEGREPEDQQELESHYNVQYTDPWEQPFIIEFDRSKRPTVIRVKSIGRDGFEGTEDDIVEERTLNV